MNKLTAEKCREMFLTLFSEKRHGEITLKEDLYLQALEIALPVLEQQESKMDTNPQTDNDGWVQWNGGKCPVGYAEQVELKLSNGTTDKGRASNFVWINRVAQGFVSIVAYRVI